VSWRDGNRVVKLQTIKPVRKMMPLMTSAAATTCRSDSSFAAEPTSEGSGSSLSFVEMRDRRLNKWTSALLLNALVSCRGNQ